MKKLLHLLLFLVLALASCTRPEPVTDPETSPILPVWESGSKYRIVYHEGEDDNLSWQTNLDTETEILQTFLYYSKKS